MGDASMTERLLRFVLCEACEPPASDDLGVWWTERVRAAGAWQTSFDAGVARALGADRLGFAFAAGYHAALRTLIAELPDEELVAFCATEQGGARPRAIATRLELGEGGSGRLSGKKRFSTFGTRATELLVVASIGTDASGKNSLRVVRVAARAPGVTITPLPELPFSPEIPHAEITLEAVEVAPGAVLPGDGYDRYLKPFRTVEDLHVHAVLLAYLIGVGRRSAWPRETLERTAAELVAARALALESPSAPEVHVALAGLVESGRALLRDSEPLWASVNSAERERWTRDRPLFEVAGSVRAARRDRAWQRLGA